MHLYVQKLRSLIATDNANQYGEKLLLFLKPGKKNVYGQAYQLTKNANLKDLNTFINRLVEEQPVLCQFLYSWYKGKQAFANKDWEEATQYLEEANQNYSKEYSLRKAEIETYLHKSTCAKQIQIHGDLGNNYYERHEWEPALKEYRKAEYLYRKDLPFPKDELDDVIEICEKGIAYDRHIQRARYLVSEGEWEEAHSEYTLAKGVFVLNFEPDIEELETEILACQKKLKPAKNIQGGLVMQAFEKRPYTIIMGLMIGMVSMIYMGYNSSLYDESPQETPVSTETLITDQKMPVSDDEHIEDLRDISEIEKTEAILVQQVDKKSNVQVNQLSLEQAKPIQEERQEPVLNKSIVKEEKVPQKLAVTIPQVLLDIAGKRAVGESLKFKLENFDPAFTYIIDFGNGIQKRIIKETSFTYSHPGDYAVKIQVVHKTGASSSFSKELNIENAQDQTLITSNKHVSSNQAGTSELSSSMLAEKDKGANPIRKSAVIQDFAEASKSVNTVPETQKPLRFAEVMPQFPGGDPAMFKFLNQKLKYPKFAKENEVQGKVYIQFLIQTDGSLSNFSVLRGIGYGCDEEALRVIKKMPNWIPGRQAGNRVAVWYTLPVTFKFN